MDLMQQLLSEFVELGPDVSFAVYQFPPTVQGPLILGLLSQHPQVSPLLSAGSFKIVGAKNDDGAGMMAVGGMVDANLLFEVHSLIMSIGGVEHVVAGGPGSARIPQTAMGMSAVGAHARSLRPWWKFWG